MEHLDPVAPLGGRVHATRAQPKPCQVPTGSSGAHIHPGSGSLLTCRYCR